MLNDLLQSKNAPGALTLLLVGLLLAVALPAGTAFPGWAAGFIGLIGGAVAGVLAMQGSGANRDELLSLRTGVKAAHRAERSARPAGLSPELSEVFNAIDDLSAEVEARHHRIKELEANCDKLRGDLSQRGEQLAQTDQELRRVMDALTAGLSDQAAAIEQVGSSMRQTAQVLGSVAESVE